jgi:hypothetical protein
MPKHRITFQALKRILRSYDVDWRQGRGDHVVFFKQFEDGMFTYPVPERKDVLPAYIKACRKKFRLLPEHGVTDEEFFGRA